MCGPPGVIRRMVQINHVESAPRVSNAHTTKRPKRLITECEGVNNFRYNLRTTYRFIAQLFNATSQKCRLSHTCRYITWHIKIEVRMQRHIWVDAIIVSGRSGNIWKYRNTHTEHEKMKWIYIIKWDIFKWIQAATISTVQCTCKNATEKKTRTHFRFGWEKKSLCRWREEVIAMKIVFIYKIEMEHFLFTCQSAIFQCILQW